MSGGKLNWLEIPTADRETSIRFYEAVFGWKVDRNEGQPDLLDETLANVVRYGGTIVQGKKAIVAGKDWFAIFRDPAGNALQLYEAAEER